MCLVIPLLYVLHSINSTPKKNLILIKKSFHFSPIEKSIFSNRRMVKEGEIFGDMLISLF